MKSNYTTTRFVLFTFALTLVGALLSPVARRSRHEQSPAAPIKARAAADYGKLPLYFVENRGQTDARVGYYVQGDDKAVYFTDTGLTFVLNGMRNAECEVRNEKAAYDPHSADTPHSNRWALKLDFVGARAGVRPAGEAQTEAVISYFKGHPSQWKTGLRTYSRIVYRNLWPGIDLVYAGTVNRMKYTFTVRPGADPNQIKLAYRGASDVTINAAGELAVRTPGGGFTDDRPVSWQEADGRQVEVATSYRLDGQSPISHPESPIAYGFAVGEYDRSRELVIDPAVFVYAGYIGGSGGEFGRGIAVDSTGAAYITGQTNSTETTFPDGDGFGAVTGPDTTYNGGTSDAFVVKVNAAGTALVYAGYIGGSGNDVGRGIAVDSGGNAYVVGETDSTEASFPDGDGFGAVTGPDTTYNGGTFDAFVVKVNAAGTALAYAGYIGGSGQDVSGGITVDSGGNAYVFGQTGSTGTTFPDGDGFGAVTGPDTTYNGGASDAFVAKVNAAGTALVYAGYIGGGSTEFGESIAVDSTGAAYVTGFTLSTQTTFPDGDGFGGLTGPDLTQNGGLDAFVAKVNAAGTALVYAGYIGGSGNENGAGIAVDSAGNAYIMGQTDSTEATFPDGDGFGAVTGPDTTYNGGTEDAFMAKVNAAGTALVYVGYIGGSGNLDDGEGIAVDSTGAAYITGRTDSTEATFPDGDGFGTLTGPDTTFNGGGSDGFVAKVNAAGSALAYAGYIGGTNSENGGSGIAVDSVGAAYVTGQTSSTEASFPDGDGFGALPGPDTTSNGGGDAFIVKISVIITVNTTADDAPDTGNCTLREAIMAANNNVPVDACPAGAAGLDTIQFNVGTGTPSIAVTGAALPAITEPLTIDGATGGATRVELNGAGVPGAANGLNLTAGNSTIKSLVVNRFSASGIRLDTGGGNTVQNCFIGTNAAGTAALANSGANGGLFVFSSANNLIGGTTAGQRNVISGNTGAGVRIFGVAATGNLVQGNYIGTDAAGAAAIANGANGVEAGSNNTIGGATAGAGNVISGNVSSGLTVGSGTVVQGNFIGTNAAGTLALPNTSSGVNVSEANNTIGGTTAAARNVISGNGSLGVLLLGGGATNNLVQGNYIGTNAAGTAAIGNVTGVSPQLGATNNAIGGTTAGAGNLISGNNLIGVLIDGATTTGNLVLGNFIGTNAAGTAAIANSSGVSVSNDATGNTIGGTTAGAGNLIAFNTQRGVGMTGAAAINNRVSNNAIVSNGALGIDLGNDGVTANDPGDGDGSPNRLQNFPVLNSVTSTGTISGAIDSTVGNSAYPVRLEFFANATCDGTGNGEGEVLLGFVSQAAPGNFTFNFTPVMGKPFITATATDNNGNSSEFAACRLINIVPTITTGAPLTRQQGSAAINAQIATVGDPEQALNTLAVQVNNGTSATVTGVTVSNLAVNVAGVVTADVVASCTASNATFTLKVIDGVGEMNTATLTVNVTANAAPTLGTYPATGPINTGSGTTVTPSAVPADNGSVAGVTASAPGFTGTFSGNAMTGVVTISNAGPPGNYVVTVTATDNCGATTNATFTLFIDTPPTISAVANARAAGSTATNSQIATVADPDQALNTLTVQVNNGASATVNNVTVSNLSVTASAVNAHIGTTCGATTATFTLKVTDNLNLMNTATLTVTVTPNTAPTLGVYAATTVTVGGGATVTPSAAPADNDSVMSVMVAAAPNTFTGTLIPNPATGVVTVSNAGPMGNYTITVTATDNCTAPATTTFTLGVGAQTITVNTMADTVAADGFCSLREAITAANTNAVVNECNAGAPSLDNIAFNIPGSGVRTINVTSALPTITEAVNIDGYTQPMASANSLAVGNNAVLLIELNGLGAGAVNGVGIIGSGSTVRGLVINRFGAGIFILGATANNNRIEGNFIGTNPAGAADLGNAGRGIQIDTSASNNTIGGTSPDARNLVSGNDQAGIFMGTTALDNVVQGNYVGTNAAGTAAIGNTVGIQTGPNTLVGGTTQGAGNLISGNSNYGLGTDNNTTVQGNIIGLNATGTVALPNFAGLGIGGVNNIIGGTTAAARNIISGNNPSHGITIFPGTGHQILGNYIGVNAAGTAPVLNTGEAIILDGVAQIGGTTPGAGNLIAGRVRLGTNGNTVQGNLIGTDGTTSFGNTSSGILVFGANNTIGGTTANARNVISGNADYGISINGAAATNNLVQGNFIGTNAAGTAAIGNSPAGVRVITATNNIIGGTAAGARNVISGNNGIGVQIDGATATGNQVLGNFIGVKVNGTEALGNGSIGVFISAGANNIIGGSAIGARNVISANGGGGVRLSGTATNNTVLGNYIGTDVNGTAALGNLGGLSGGGVRIETGATGNIIGGTAGTTPGGACSGACNLISGNATNGVNVEGPTTGATQMLGNFIGVNVTGTAALANANGGVVLRSTANNTVGGTTPAARNVISGNTQVGINIFEVGATGNVVQGNFIGTNAAGTTGIPNAEGVNLNTLGGAGNNLIGGTTAAAGNLIAFNLMHGVLISTATNVGNSVLGNRIFNNGTLGIDLAPSGITQNDAGDGDAGPNGLQNFPLLTAVSTIDAGIDSTTTFQGTLNSTANTDFRLEFFSNPMCDASGNGEGRGLLGFTEVTTNASGNAVINITLPTPRLPMPLPPLITAGDFVTATATNLTTMSTSEFSPCVCSFGFLPPAAPFTAAGGSGSFGIITAPTCSWTVTLNPGSFVVLNGTTSGTGNGTVSYTVPPQAGLTLRSDLINVTGPALPAPNQLVPVAPNQVIITQAGNTGMLIQNQNFAAQFPPPGWTNIDGGTGSGQDERWLNPPQAGTLACQTPANTGFPNQNDQAFVNAECADPGNQLDERFVAPPFNATGMGAVFVEFLNQFRAHPAVPNNKGDVDVSIDGGLNWMNVLRLMTDDGTPNNPTLKTLNLTPFIGLNAPNVLVRLRYTGTAPPSTPFAAKDARLRQKSPTGDQFAYWAVDFSIYGFGINPMSNSFTAAGGTGAVNVVADAGRPWMAACNVPWITNLTPPAGNGNGTVSYTVQPNTNPGGTGRIGTCAIAGNTFTVTQLGQACTPITLNPAALANGFVGAAYSQMLTATGGTPAYTFSVTSGALPTGLMFNGATGALTGTPTVAGVFNFTVGVSDNNTCPGSRSYTIAVSSNNGLQFYPLPRPLRLLDTRADQSLCDNVGLPITGGTALTTQARITCNGLTIPANAQAIVGNVTVINQTASFGFLTLFPAGQTLPLAANIIYEPGQLLSNNFTVGLNANGEFSTFAERTLHTVIDVSGYFAPPGAGGLFYHALPRPLRLLDTRADQSLCDNVGAPITGGTALTTQARITCNGVTIPAAAQAIVGNATVINQTAQFGFMTLFPSGQTLPLAANMIYAPNQLLANYFTVGLNANGQFDTFGERTIHAVIDVAGYYSTEAVDANGPGLLFNPLPRLLRLLDTRADQSLCDNVGAPIAAGTSLTTQARITCQGITIPAGAQTVNGNITVINTTASFGFLTLFPAGQTLPLAANMIYAPGQLLSNAFVVGLSGLGEFNTFGERTIHVVVDVSGYFAL